MPKIRTFVGLAILAGLLFVGPAFSQVSPQVCAVNVGVQPTVRAEGNTERVGEITFTCTGGIPNGAGQVLPAVNIQVILNTAVTSRIYPNGFSEAMVMIDEPGSGLAGTTNTQLACNDPNGICVVTGKGAGSGDFDGTQGRPNIFPGKVSGNSVTFFGIPVDPPGNGPSRV